MNLYDWGFLVLYAVFLGESVMHWTQNWVFFFLTAFTRYGYLMVVDFRFLFPLLPSYVLHGWIALLFYTLPSSLITLPWISGNGNLLWVFLGRALEKILGWWNKTKKGNGRYIKSCVLLLDHLLVFYFFLLS